MSSKIHQYKHINLKSYIYQNIQTLQEILYTYFDL